MKKYLISGLIILLGASAVYAQGTVIKSPEDLEHLQDNFYHTPFGGAPEVNIEDPIGNTDYINSGFGGDSIRGMPLFKQIRIKLTNKYRIKNHEEQLKEEEQERLEQQKLNAKDMTDSSEVRVNNVKIKIKNAQDIDEISQEDTDFTPDSEMVEKETESKKKFSLKNLFIRKSDADDDKLPEIKVEDTNPEKIEQAELSGGVKTVDAEKEVQLDCDVVEYFNERDEIEATGNPILTFPNQETTLKADKIVYVVSANIVKAYGNVEVKRQGSIVYGDYMQINMNEENAFMDNMKSAAMMMTVHAKKAYANDDKIILEKGDMVGEQSYILRTRTMMMGYRLDTMLIDPADYSYLKDTIGERKFKIVAKDIYVNAKKDHDVVTVKDADIYYGDKKLFRWPSFTAHTDKRHGYFEANYPELGSRARIGMYAGPGFVFDLPNASTVKVIPFLNYRSKIGFGGAIKYRSATNFTEVAYGSAENIFIARGRQDFDDNLYMQYGINQYTDDWFLGQRMSKYIAELVYRKGYMKRDYFGKNLDFNFRHRATAGYVQEGDYNVNNEEFDNPEIGTMRFKYMAQVDQNLYRWGDMKKRKYADLGITLQGSATMYGTGDTQFIGRVGPRLHSQYNYWMQDIGYFLSAYQDGTPTPRFDAYRYGHSNVYLRETFRLTKYLRIAWLGSANLSNDAPNGEIFQENAFIVSLGPDDFQVSLGYDFIRGNTYFGVYVALDTKGTSVVYDKMVIKNPERLSQSDKKDVELVTFETEPQKTENKVYAQVIDIEDPNKEEI